ncbi:unnamed protein product [Cylindrotheca closterium]|uniref:DUF1995 domain-containing protein n=1 Tax=Cylindrotheca closterium TaxID=2856 RepID=A0AAD2FIG8_9STRA|nr:unnamed protein product [Cylindrotheca closterium]
MMNPLGCALLLALTGSVVSFTSTRPSHAQIISPLFSTPTETVSTPTELPDSMEDAAEIAAKACAQFAEASGPLGRCRITFDTSAGDETYTILKTSSEFMQNVVSYVCYQMIPGLQEIRQGEMMKVAQARAELQAILDQEEAGDADVDQEKKASCIQILETGGRDPDYKWEGPNVRVYFPDEGSAALARRDWMGNSAAESKVPPCVLFSSCGGVQMGDVSKDEIIFFFCPKASESGDVEKLLMKTETTSDNLKLTVFVNPNLVDMGVTGFGMAGRQLRERLLDGLVDTYYLRTLQWGALTRTWPNAYSVWQEDEESEGGYKLIKSLPYLPSNPEVEDIYDIANGLMDEREGGGFLDQFGDFVNGMMRL